MTQPDGTEEQFTSIRTTVCGVYSPSRNNPPIQPPSCKQGRSNKEANAYCCICLGWFRGKSAVLDHFESCVSINGNPQSHCWDDHATCKGYKPRKDRTGNTANQAHTQMNAMPVSSPLPTRGETPQFPSSQALPSLRRLENRTPQLLGSQNPLDTHGRGAHNGYNGAPFPGNLQNRVPGSHIFPEHDPSRPLFRFDSQISHNGVHTDSTRQGMVGIGASSLDLPDRDGTVGGGPLSFEPGHDHRQRQ